MNVIIRKLKTHEEYLAAEDIQRIVWHFPEREVIPLNELVVAQKNGGHVFGAFDRRKMIAFCFGVPGFKDGKVYHYSRMLGVLPPYQDASIGHALKLRQREYCLEQGLNLVRWTFDPLQSRNAYFNIEKLGCVAREYVVNIYGQSGSRFNRGLETDRLVPEWWIASKRVRDVLEGRHRPPTLADAHAYAPVVESKRGGDPLPARTNLRDRRLRIEVPASIDGVKERDLKLARRWRAQTRAAFLACFRRGYVAHGYATGTDGGRRRSFYLLERGYRVR